LPPAELARIRARFQQVCSNQIALPGSGIDAASLESCAEALEVSACQLPQGPPSACDFRGALPGGAACTDDVQCASGWCAGTELIAPGGPVDPITCGTCMPVVEVGQTCDAAGCPQNAICLNADTTAAESTASCVEVVEGDVGAPCDDLSVACQPGLSCHGGSCTPLVGEGAACWSGGCAPPVVCGNESSTCGSGTAGADCVTDVECAPGFGCVPVGPCGSTARIGCSASGQCTAIEWAAPGEPCSYEVRCLVGACVFPGMSGQDTDGSLLVGACPTVVPDGEPCTARSTCDTLAECFEGECSLLDEVACDD
jgi:hypothetical protein